MMNEKRKQRFNLTLLASLIVFALIVVAIAIAIAIIYILFQFNFIRSISETPSLSTVLIFVALVSAIIGFLITMLLSKIPLKPVNHFIDELQQLAKGDYKARINFGKLLSFHPIFGEVQDSFNASAEELEQTEMLRSDFVNNFSHEFKTPIVSIAGFAKLLRYGNLTEQEKDEYLTAIEEESLRLSNMANNVLNLTKVENQTILTNISRFNLSEQLRSSVLLLMDTCTQKEINLDVDFDEHMIVANEELLEQVWINLLDNAVKFSEQGGTVTVNIFETKSNVNVTISNYGNDIPKESLDRIFNKFYQADESHSSAGNGIGLAVVKKVVDLHKGKISVKSENGTTTFTVALPKEQ